MSHTIARVPLCALDARPLFFDPDNEYRIPLERLLASIVAMTAARAASLRVLHEATGKLKLICATGMSDAMREAIASTDASCGACGHALSANATAYARANCQCAQLLAQDSAPARDVTVIPLRVRDRACGVLSLFHTSAHMAESDLCGLLPALSEVLGLALENCRQSEERLMAGVVHERHLLANEVHDALAQNLTSARMRISLLRDAVRDTDKKRSHGYLGEIDETLRVAQARVRELITHFRTEMDPRGLVPALETTIAELGGLSGIRIRFSNRTPALDLTPEQELQAYYILREALTNAVKHSGANEVRLNLDLSDNRDHYEFAIEDNGIGLESDQCGEHGHFGLNIMRERAARIGGDVAFEGLPGRGTRVCLSFRTATADHRGHA